MPFLNNTTQALKHVEQLHHRGDVTAKIIWRPVSAMYFILAINLVVLRIL